MRFYFVDEIKNEDYTNLNTIDIKLTQDRISNLCEIDNTFRLNMYDLEEITIVDHSNTLDNINKRVNFVDIKEKYIIFHINNNFYFGVNIRNIIHKKWESAHSLL
uniref:Uncharacterized protein n=1 Tax=Pithovirus LCDPAC02 TaxID=2506601 RepID=A0A481YPT8_9VIRU|nr:MAG: hypothetical protein LCDPAC02_02190 [Pithovirus LCDPAC02]